MKLLKAVRGLAGGVSDVVFRQHGCKAQDNIGEGEDEVGSFSANIWIAAGSKVSVTTLSAFFLMQVHWQLFNYDLSTSEPKLVLSPDDARKIVSVGSSNPNASPEQQDTENSINHV